MTRESAFKRRVRERMRKTGESYAAARSELDRRPAAALHVTNGDSTAAGLREGGVAGEVLPWRQRGYEVVEDLVYVDPVYQGKGVGRELLSRAIEAARSTGCRTIVASVATDNVAGLKLHQSLGFEIVGTLKNAAYKFGRWMDITLVQRQI